MCQPIPGAEARKFLNWPFVPSEHWRVYPFMYVHVLKLAWIEYMNIDRIEA